MRRAMLSLLILATGAMPAAADEWQYCFALERAAGRFLMSRPFPTSDPPLVVVDRFARYLEDVGVAAPPACPRAAEPEIITSRMREAERYNRQQGFVIAPLTWPPEAVVRR